MKIIVWIEFSHGKVKSASLEALGSARTLPRHGPAPADTAFTSA
jgi:hypothetical protein